MSAIRSRRPPTRALVVLGLAGMTLAACGSSGATPSAYVRSICTTLLRWKDGVQSAGSGLQTSGAATATPANAKHDYLTFVSALDHATERAASALRSAPAPSVSDGKQIAGRLSGAFARAAGGLGAAYERALAIPTTSVQAFDSAAGGVTAQIKASLHGIATITPEHSAPLRAAASSDATCRALTG